MQVGPVGAAVRGGKAPHFMESFAEITPHGTLP
jgi:hypothetical protein